MADDWPYRTQPERDMSDPVFANLVMTLEALVSRHEFSPAEMRQAVVMACVRHESRTLRHVHFRADGIEWKKPEGT